MCESHTFSLKGPSYQKEGALEGCGLPFAQIELK